MKTFQKYVIPSLCILNVILHLLSIRYLEFHRDELLYFSLSNHLDLGYASVPPLIAILAFVMKGIFGFSMLSVKLLPALLSGVFIYLGTRITKEIGGGYFAQLLTAVALICTPFNLRAFILFQPVPFDVFFWTLIYFIILKYIHTHQHKWLYFLGAIIGIALLNKYLVILQLFSLLAVLPFTRYRTLFKNTAFYYGIAIALIITSPNIYWQFANDTPLFTHMNALSETQLQYVSKSAFLLDQVLMFYFSTCLAFLGLFYLTFRQKKKQLWLFAASSILVILALLLLNGKSYYTAGVYPFLIAAGSVYLSMLVQNKWSRIVLLCLLPLMILPLVPLGIPIFPPKDLALYFDQLEEHGIDVGRIHENGEKYPLPQDFADMIGWKEIAALAREAYEQVDNKNACAIYGENYGIAGAVGLINEKHGLPEPISFSDTYRYWIPKRFEPDLTSLIYINDELGNDVKKLFQDIKIIGQIEDPLSRQYGVTIYLCQYPRRSFNEFWKETVDRLEASE